MKIENNKEHKKRKKTSILNIKFTSDTLHAASIKAKKKSKIIFTVSNPQNKINFLRWTDDLFFLVILQ